jgi:hypothetical protein
MTLEQRNEILELAVQLSDAAAQSNSFALRYSQTLDSLVISLSRKADSPVP